MEIAFAAANYLVLLVAIAIPLLALSHRLRPWKRTRTVVDKLGIVLAVCGLLQTYSFITLVFANWYSETRYFQQFFGTWYSSSDYPWVIHASTIPLILAFLAFWCKPVRRHLLIASILCGTILLPSIHDLIFPTDAPPTGVDFGS